MAHLHERMPRALHLGLADKRDARRERADFLEPVFPAFAHEELLELDLAVEIIFKSFFAPARNNDDISNS